MFCTTILVDYWLFFVSDLLFQSFSIEFIDISLIWRCLQYCCTILQFPSNCFYRWEHNPQMLCFQLPDSLPHWLPYSPIFHQMRLNNWLDKFTQFLFTSKSTLYQMLIPSMICLGNLGLSRVNCVKMVQFVQNIRRNPQLVLIHIVNLTPFFWVLASVPQPMWESPVSDTNPLAVSFLC